MMPWQALRCHLSTSGLAAGLVHVPLPQVIQHGAGRGTWEANRISMVFFGLPDSTEHDRWISEKASAGTDGARHSS